jgi:hypothetical protein
MLCHATSISEQQSDLHRSLPCLVIYSKEYQHGTLYGLVLVKQTYVGTMDKEICKLDESFKKTSGDQSTKFTSISNSLSGKVKTFGIGDHAFDEHFRAIFLTGSHSGSKGLKVDPGVRAWYPDRGFGPLNESDLYLKGIENVETGDEETRSVSLGDKRSSSSTESGAKRTKVTGASGSFMEYDDEYSAAIKQVQSDKEVKKAQAELVKANALVRSLRSEVATYQAKAKADDDKIKTLLREKEEYKAKADAADARQGSHSRELNKSKAETARVAAELTNLKQEFEEFKASQVVVSGGGVGDDDLREALERLRAENVDLRDFKQKYEGGHEELIFDNARLRWEVIVFCLTTVFMCVDLT